VGLSNEAIETLFIAFIALGLYMAGVESWMIFTILVSLVYLRGPREH